jgi:hypothetical protein
MATWEYRVLTSEDGAEIYAMHYEDDGRLCARAADPACPHGEDLGELKRDLERMLAACRKEPLTRTAVDAAIKGTGPAIYAGPRGSHPVQAT